MILVITAAVLLFLFAFITKRRFGVLGLALAAGALLSSLWQGDLVPIVARFDSSLSIIMATGIASTLLVLAPAFFLSFSGPAYKNMHGRIVGSILFTVVSVVLLLEPLGSFVVFEGVSADVRDRLLAYQPQIITAAIVVAILDVWMIHAGSKGAHKKGHK